jgi:(4-alkanoyl-5-oxo-2,5-dihydrofuran-3-yl)methyl phosphate reductase
MTVLVCGATGTTGGEVLRQLRDRGVQLRAMTRSEKAAERFREEGIKAVVADLAEPSTLTKALGQAAAVYVANSASPELPQHEHNLARAAAESGVRHLVKLSVIGAGGDSPLTFARVHHQAEDAVRAAGIGWTMVRPNGFMQNTLTWSAQIQSGVIRGPVMDARWSIVDVRDVAAVAVTALLDPQSHASQTYTVTGPEASSPRQKITTIAELLGRPLKAEEVTVEQAQASMPAQGWPTWSVEWMGELFRHYADGLAETVSPDVELVTERGARDFRAFATDHLERLLAA